MPADRQTGGTFLRVKSCLYRNHWVFIEFFLILGGDTSPVSGGRRRRECADFGGAEGMAEP
jgi:hypothetical protein